MVGIGPSPRCSFVLRQTHSKAGQVLQCFRLPTSIPSNSLSLVLALILQCHFQLVAVMISFQSYRVSLPN